VERKVGITTNGGKLLNNGTYLVVQDVCAEVLDMQWSASIAQDIQSRRPTFLGLAVLLNKGVSVMRGSAKEETLDTRYQLVRLRHD
jgi:hypothetical protein